MREQKKEPLPTIDEAALKRADETLRRMLASPPAPFTPKAKKRVKKK